MDAAQSPSTDESDITGPAQAGPSRSRWIVAPLALGALLAVASLPLGDLLALLQEWGVENPYFYKHQDVLDTWITAIQALALSLVILGVALVITLRGALDSRRAAIIRLCAVFVLLLAFVWAELPVATALYQAQVGPKPDLKTFPTFLWSQLVRPAWQGATLGLRVILLLRLVTPSLLPLRRVTRAGYGALAGALAGLVAACFELVNAFILFTILYLRLAYVDPSSCTPTFGSCYGDQLQRLGFQAAPVVVGAALGGLVGALLIPQLRAARQAPPASSANSSSRRRGGRALLVVDALVGLLYALYVIVLIAHSGGAASYQPLTASFIFLPLVALAIPTALFALVAARHRLAAALTPQGGRMLLLGIALFTALVALIAPASLLFARQIVFAARYPQVNSLIVLSAFCLGAALAAIAVLRAPAPSRRTGLLAAAFGWLGFSLVLAAIVAFTFYSLVIPGATTITCHGLGCGGLYLAAVDSIIGGGVETILFGLPAALLAGSLVGVLGAALRASTSQPATSEA